MAKEKTVFVCSACGYETPRWMGKCPGCNAWNTLEEQAPQAAQQAAIPVKANKQRPGTGASAMRLSEIPEETSARATTGIGELDRVLGGGVVEGSLMLVGGDPGIGKSTLLPPMSDVTEKLHNDGEKTGGRQAIGRRTDKGQASTGREQWA